MQQAEFDDELVTAGPDSPQVARCPACGEAVCKRSRRQANGETTWFYRHQVGAGKDCHRRYRPAG